MTKKDAAERLADDIWNLRYGVQHGSRKAKTTWWISLDRERLLALIRKHFHPFDRVGYMREYMRKRRAKTKRKPLDQKRISKILGSTMEPVATAKYKGRSVQQILESVGLAKTKRKGKR